MTVCLGKMRGLLWFLSAVLLLGSTDGRQGYGDPMKFEDLHEHTRTIINKAIVKANEDYGKKHIDFYSILDEDNTKKMIHVLLKSTTCDGTITGHRKDCEVSKGIPWVSCLACGEEMTCMLFKEIRKMIQNKDNCTAGKGSYIPGVHNMLAQTEFIDQDHGCLGCI